MKVREVTAVIEAFAPLSLQESYDNSGLIVGRPDDEVHKALLAVDVTEEVLTEAVAEGCDMVITHHPIVFHPMKRFNSASVTERCVEEAIRRGIVLYAAHTNLDSAPQGMSWRVAEMLDSRILRSCSRQMIRVLVLVLWVIWLVLFRAKNICNELWSALGLRLYAIAILLSLKLPVLPCVRGLVRRLSMWPEHRVRTSI